VDQYNVNVWITYDITLRNTYYNTTGRRSIFPATEDTRNMIFMQIELSSRLLKPAISQVDVSDVYPSTHLHAANVLDTWMNAVHQIANAARAVD